MNTKQNLTKIARLIVQNGDIDKKTAKELIENLSRKNLSVFASMLNTFENQNVVKVLSSDALPYEVKKQIASRFDGKKVIFEIDDSVGDGIQLIYNDTIIDLTVNGFIDSTIEKLKN